MTIYAKLKNLIFCTNCGKLKIPKWIQNSTLALMWTNQYGRYEVEVFKVDLDICEMMDLVKGVLLSATYDSDTIEEYYNGDITDTTHT
jgi:hypothetical protein